jgi:hypothetical protein
LLALSEVEWVRAGQCEPEAACRGLPALPMRRRAAVWTIYPHPILGSLAQCFANRIHQDVAGFLFEFVMVAQAMIEKIALPIHAMFSSDELLPILDGRCHSRLAWECDDCVQMVWHKQTQAAMPDESLVIEFDGGQHGIAGVCTTQLVFVRRHAVDRDKELAAVGYPLRNCVRQLFADKHIHGKLITRLRWRNREKVGRAVLYTPFHLLFRRRRSAE